MGDKISQEDVVKYLHVEPFITVRESAEKRGYLEAVKLSYIHKWEYFVQDSSPRERADEHLKRMRQTIGGLARFAEGIKDKSFSDAELNMGQLLGGLLGYFEFACLWNVNYHGFFKEDNRELRDTREYVLEMADAINDAIVAVQEKISEERLVREETGPDGKKRIVKIYYHSFPQFYIKFFGDVLEKFLNDQRNVYAGTADVLAFLQKLRLRLVGQKTR